QYSKLWWKSNIHESDRERVLHSIEQCIEQKCDRWEADYRFRRADGTYGWFLDRGSALINAEGGVTRMIGAMADISRRKLAEERHRFLLKLNDRLAFFADPEDILDEALYTTAKQ